MNRKTFLKGSTSLFLLTATGFSLKSCSNNVDSNVSDDNIVDSTSPGITVEDNRIVIALDSTSGELLAEKNGWLLIRDKRVLVLNTDGENINAFSSVCPHAFCAVNWTSRNGNFTCTCHGSVFNSKGEVQSGPANQDLSSFQTSVSSTQIEIIT